MDIRLLQKKSERKEYVKVAGNVEKKYYDAVSTSGLSSDAILNEAYKELYEQLDRQGALTNLALNAPKKEVLRHTLRGEIVNPVTLKDRIKQFFQEHQDESYTVADLQSHFTDLDENSVKNTLYILSSAREGFLEKDYSNTGHFWIKKDRELVPPGTVFESNI